MPQTLDDFRRKGLEVLRRELGRAGLIRFLQQFSSGEGDYARFRQEWVDDVSLDDLRELAKAKAAKKPKNAKAPHLSTNE